LKIVDATFAATGASSIPDARGMREMQQRVFASRSSRYLLVKAPPASGKSRGLMYYALDKLHEQGVRKVVVAVPEQSIGASFADTDLTTGGFPYDWKVEPRWDLCTDVPDKTSAIRDFMASDDRVLVCTHAAFRFAYDALGGEAFSDCLIAIDEFHHTSADETNRLGSICRDILDQGDIHLLAMTGSYFRGDNVAVLRPDDERRFDQVVYTYYEQLNGYKHLRSLGLGYHFYEGGNYMPALRKFLDSTKKTIVHIPNVNTAASTGDKLVEVGMICDMLGTFDTPMRDPVTGFLRIVTPDGRRIKVADLVTDDQGRAHVLKSLRSSKKRDDVDVVIALNMAKEGFDWPWCEHALTIGHRGSLTEVIQIIGRCTRDAEGKSHAQFTNLIAEPSDTRSDVKEAVNNLVKAIACALLMEQVIAPDYKFKTKAEPKDDDVGTTTSIPVAAGGRPMNAVTIDIKGFREASTPLTRQIVDNDLNDLKAAILQDPEIMMTAAVKGSRAAERINKHLIPQLIAKRYPEATKDEIEEVRQNFVASALFKSSAVRTGDDGSRFVEDGNRFIDVKDLHIDMIDRICPFASTSYSILSKTIDEKVLRHVQAAYQAVRTPMSEEEMMVYYHKAGAFKISTGRAPARNPNDDEETMMARAVDHILAERARRKALKTEPA
jgi:hypothetical protein